VSKEGRYESCSLRRFVATFVAAGAATSRSRVCPRDIAGCVQFDVRSTVSCRDVTTEEFALANPYEKLMEARIQVSSLIAPAGSQGLIAYLYQIESPLRTFEVADYLPKTTLGTSVVGNVGVDQREEEANTVGITLSGSYEKLAKGAGTVGFNEKNSNGKRYEYLPPLELLSASGTIQRGAGVYFKLKPSPRTSLEGEKEFVLVLRTPKTWRGDYLVLRCEAFGQATSRDKQTHFGFGQFYVALYAEGDAEAQLAARRFIRSDRDLLNAAAAKRGEIDRRSLPTFIHKWGAAISLVHPKIDEHWLVRVRGARPGSDVASLLNRLPEAVQDAAKSHLESKRRLAELNGWGDEKTPLAASPQ